MYRIHQSLRLVGVRSTTLSMFQYTPQRTFGYRGRKRRPKKPTPKEPPKQQSKLEILARPPGEKEQDFQSKFPLPDQDKERELSGLQIHVQDNYKKGDYRKALEVSDVLLQQTKEHFGETHPATAAAHNNMGLMRKQLGHFEDSRVSYNAALKIYKQTVGISHSSYASALHNLGNLNRNQIHFDTSLNATDRLSLVESALEFLEQAYNIRKAELGTDHPLSVASRSAWGATLSTQILYQHKMTESIRDSGDLVRKKFYLSMLPTKITQSLWEAAAEHLETALKTAIAEPRGQTVADATTTTTPTRGKKKKKQTPSTNPKEPQTLSAAAAAQNYAIFWKTRATTEEPYNADMLQQAKTLYDQAIFVYEKLLPENHPDLYLVKHSLAELLAIMGHEDEANQLRQEIIDAYAPVEETEDGEHQTEGTPTETKANRHGD